MRPLPQLTPATEWFWTSGADGRLRIQGCTDCGKLVHPPVPICPACRSRAWEPTALSGRGTVVGFTVNRHQWLPGLRTAVRDRERRARRGPERAPHDEHRRLRSRRRCTSAKRSWSASNSTKTCGCRCSSRPARPRPTTTSASRGARRRDRRSAPIGSSTVAVLSGVGRSAIGRRLMVDPLSLTVDACLAAIADAGLDARRHRRAVDLPRRLPAWA